MVKKLTDLDDLSLYYLFCGVSLVGHSRTQKEKGEQSVVASALFLQLVLHHLEIMNSGLCRVSRIWLFQGFANGISSLSPSEYRLIVHFNEGQENTQV